MEIFMVSIWGLIKSNCQGEEAVSVEGVVFFFEKSAL